MLVDKDMKCLICNSGEFVCIHKGTRDVPHINVMKCQNCGMVQLDCRKYNTEENYTGGGMLKNTYAAVMDITSDMSWELWVQETERDDDRRYSALKELCSGKKILEFGCGNGGFLKRIKSVAASVTGIELMHEAREKIRNEGIKVFKDLSETDEKFDVVCMFMVIEHLNSPCTILEKIYNALNPGGTLVCETANADDALIVKYNCAAFEDFTYWSEHVFLYTSETLARLLTENGFQTKQNTQIQRYSLANHLYWLSEGKPGGHMKWVEFNETNMNKVYESELVKLGNADTLWYVGMKDLS